MKDEPFQPGLDFEAAMDAADAGEALVVDLDGFEGPLDLLLVLARAQKIDLLQLSVTALADQYLAFINEARERRFTLAGDYLVMAAWLTYLKSRLLLPKPEKAAGDEAPAHELAAALAFRLAKLDAMRKAVEALKALPQTGRDVFGRGDPDAIEIHAEESVDVDLYALMRAYADQRRKAAAVRRYAPAARVAAYPLEEARVRLREIAPALDAWTSLRGIAPRAAGEGPSRASYLASTLSAGLELVREGELDARQLEAFADLYLRRHRGGALEQAA